MDIHQSAGGMTNVLRYLLACMDTIKLTLVYNLTPHISKAYYSLEIAMLSHRVLQNKIE